MKTVLTKEHAQHVESINERHTREIELLNKKLKLVEERFHREYSSRSRLESDFRVRSHNFFFFPSYQIQLILVTPN